MFRFRLLLLLLPACATYTAQSLQDPRIRVELSHQLYATLDSQQHYFGDRDEAEAFARQLHQVAESTTDATSYYRGVAHSLAQLGEGHTVLVSSATVPFANTIPPVALLEVDGHPVVAGVAPGIEGGGLQPGDLIIGVDGKPAADVVAHQVRVTAGSTAHGRRARAIASLLAGPTNAPARVRVLGVNGRERECFPLRFLLDDEGENRFRFGFVSAHVRAERISSSAGYLALPDFQSGRAAEVESHIAALTQLPILVLDLRGNPGGRIRTLQRIAGIFLDRREVLLQLDDAHGRQSIEAAPGSVSYKGHLRILVDARTGSAAELLAAALQDLGRARIYGCPTAGSTRSRRSSVLPGGVVFHYAGRAEFRRRDGSVLEGSGVTPDVAILRTRRGLSGGSYGHPQRDPEVLLAAGVN